MKMLKIIKMTVLAGFICLGAYSCLETDGEGECPYSVMIVYRYNAEGTSEHNLAGAYVRSLDTYIFDTEGRLCAQSRIDNGALASEYMLEPGRYILVSWANLSERNAVRPPVELAESLAGRWIYPVSQASGNPDMLDGGDPLYYAYRTFSVEDGRTSRLYADLEHAYCRLKITVNWKTAPATLSRNAGNYYVWLEGVPSRLGFEPQYEIAGGKVADFGTLPGEYPHQYTNGYHSYLPVVNGLNEPVTHQMNAVLQNNSISGEFITYRLTLRDDKPLQLRIFDDAGHELIPEEHSIDLKRFFKERNIALDTYRRQDFEIIIDVYPDGSSKAYLSVTQDWEEGGSLGDVW
jgi:hypothetical protein